MKTKFLLLATALFCLASCDKSQIDNNIVDKDVYSITIKEELQTKAGGEDIPYQTTRTFYAILKKNGTRVNCGDFTWKYPEDIVTKTNSGSTTHPNYGVTVGYLTVKGAKMGTGIVRATTDKSNTGGTQITSSDVDVNVTAAISSVRLTLTGDNSIVVGKNSSYKVTALYSDGTEKDVTSDATISSTNSVGLSCSGGVISSSKINGCLGKRSLTATYGGKTSSSCDFTVTTDFDYLKFNFNADSDVFSDIRDYAINSKNGSSGFQLHSETGAASGDITFSVRSFYLYIKGSYSPYYGNVTYKMDSSDFRDSITISARIGESYTLHIYYLGEEVFSQKVTIVTN